MNMTLNTHTGLSGEKIKSHKNLELATQIVASYVQNNALDAKSVNGMLESVHSKIMQLQEKESYANASLNPAVKIEDSVTPDYIICLEDGKPFKMLKKHLMSVYGLSPEEYRQKWKLPPDYPMVAPNYATRRQELAKQSGLGRRRD